MWCYKPIQASRATTPIPKRPRQVRRTHTASLVLSALAVLTLATPSAMSGFIAPLRFDAGFATYAVAVGDLNGDGIPDLVTANLYSNNVSVLLGNGDGTFQPAVNYDAGNHAAHVTIADFNHDGIPDLAVANLAGPGVPGTVSILLGKGDGTFGAAQEYAAGIDPRTVVVGDFNGDGIPDLAVAAEGTSPNYADGAISVLLGQGDGTFGPAVSFPAPNRPVALVVSDFNGDGILDLAATNDVQAGSVSVLLGKGDGTFAAAVQYPSVPLPYTMAAADLNGDGIPDLAVAGTGGYSVSVLLGNGDGTFKAAVNYTATPPGTGIISIAVGDLNGDGNLDLVAASGTTSSSGNFGGTIAVLLGKGDGTFQPPQTYTIGGAYYVALADLNRDGALDVVVADFTGNTANVLLGKGDGTFQAVPHYSAANGPQAVAVRDFNGDGILDLVTANADSNSVSVLLGNQDGSFQEAVNYPTGKSPRSVAAGDFNGDGIPDLAVANQASASVSILLGNGDGTFRTAVDYPAGGTPYSVAVADFNGDGHADLAVANYLDNGTVSVLLGNGDGTFQPAPTCRR